MLTRSFSRTPIPPACLLNSCNVHASPQARFWESGAASSRKTKPSGGSVGTTRRRRQPLAANVAFYTGGELLTLAFSSASCVTAHANATHWYGNTRVSLHSLSQEHVAQTMARAFAAISKGSVRPSGEPLQTGRWSKQASE